MNRYLIEEDIQMGGGGKQNTKDFNIIAIRNRKLTEMSHYIPIRAAKIKFKSDTPNAGEIQRNCISHTVIPLWWEYEKGSFKMHLLCFFQKYISELYY